MAIEIHFVDEASYLVAEISGQWEQVDVEQAITTLRDEAERRGYRRILLDLSEFLPPKDMMTRFYSGEFLASQLGSPFRMATLWKPEYYNRFAETVAVNRGAHILTFFERDKALEWLLEDSQ